jgi:hypothetical protein
MAMNRRGFIRSAAGVMASVLTGKALVPTPDKAPCMSELFVIKGESFIFVQPIFKPITFKILDLTGCCTVSRDQIRDTRA